MAVSPLYRAQIKNADAFAESFWARVAKSDDGCWLWTAGLHKTGYGSVAVPLLGRASRPLLAHRVAYALVHGEIPALFGCHKCDVNYPLGDLTYRKCVRPDHIFLGTNADNIQDMYDKGRGRTYSARGEDHGMTTLTEEQVREISERYAAGERRAVLAAAFHTTTATISNIAQGNTWGHVAGPRLTESEAKRGVRNPRARLTPDDVRSIRVRHANGDNYPTLSKAFSVSESAIGHIISGKNWAHVT